MFMLMYLLGCVTAATYLELHRKLEAAGFYHVQYSNWASDNSDAVDAYWIMLNLLLIHPRQPRVYYQGVESLSHAHLEAGHHGRYQLSGRYTPNLCGPTPTDLVPGNPPAIIPGDMYLPEFTRPSLKTLNHENWRVSP